MGTPGDGGDFIAMAFEGVEFQLEIPEIPEGNSFVCRGGQKDEFCGGIEGEGVDCFGMGFDFVGWFGIGVGAGVVDLEGTVVRYGGEERIVEGVEGYIAYDSSMSCIGCC